MPPKLAVAGIMMASVAAAMKVSSAMLMRRLGHTDLLVSECCIGVGAAVLHSMMGPQYSLRAKLADIQ